MYLEALPKVQFLPISLETKLEKASVGVSLRQHLMLTQVRINLYLVVSTH